jgi:hypothetical protein
LVSATILSEKLERETEFDSARLLELLSEIGELLFQVCNFRLKAGDFLPKCGYLLFQMGIPFPFGWRGSGMRLRCWLCVQHLYIAGQEMGVAGLFGAGLPGQDFDERRLALHQMLQAGLHGGQIVERVHALGAGAKFAGSLRAAE